MSYIYFPPGVEQDLVIGGTLFMPTNDAQQQTYKKALEAEALFQQYSYYYENSVVSRVGNNLHVAGRHYMPFAALLHPSDVIEPYAAWNGYNRLIIADHRGLVSCHKFSEIKDHRSREENLRKDLFIWRTRIFSGMHELDRQLIQIAIDECINQIDHSRSRQRKRIEPRR